MIQEYDMIKNTKTDERYVVTGFIEGSNRKVVVGVLMKDGADTTPFILPSGDYELLSMTVGEFDVDLAPREKYITI